MIRWDRFGLVMMVVFGVGILGALGLALVDMLRQ